MDHLLKVEENPAHQALNIKIFGRLDATNALIVEDEIKKNIQFSDTKRIILDFSELHYLSSAGLRMLIIIFKELKEKNRALVLHSLNPSVYNVIRLTGYQNFLKIVDSPEEAFEPI